MNNLISQLSFLRILMKTLVDSFFYYDLNAVYMDKDTNKYSKSSSAYIQVHKDNLVGYFAVGAIFPPDYETRELARSQRNPDIQEKNPGFLMIADGFTDTQSEEQVLLKVVLTEEDQKSLEAVADGVGLFSYPIPVSRIAAIYVDNNVVIENLKSQEQTYEDAFLPFHLFSVFPNNLPDRSALAKEVNKSAKDLATDAFAKFNAVLGLLVFMKNNNVYYPNKTFKTYSDVFLKTIKLVNASLAELPSFGEGLVEKRFEEVLNYFLSPEKEKGRYLKSVLDVIYKGEGFTFQKVKQILGKNAHEKIKKPILSLQESKTAEAIKGLDNIQEHDDKLTVLLLIFLLKYKGKDNSDKYLIKDQLKDYVEDQNRAALLLGVLGLYYGYRSLPKEEDIELSDPFHQQMASKLFNQSRFPIKFKLDSLFDRVVIESIYQFSFFNQSGNFSTYLPHEIQKKEKTSHEFLKGYDFNETDYFGKVVFTIERVPDKTEKLILDLSEMLPIREKPQLKNLEKFLKEKEKSSNELLNELKDVINQEIKEENKVVKITLSEPTGDVDNIPEIISIKAPKKEKQPEDLDQQPQRSTKPEAEGTGTKPSSKLDNKEHQTVETTTESPISDDNEGQEQPSKKGTKTESSTKEEVVAVSSDNQTSESKNKEPREVEKIENETPVEKTQTDSTKSVEPTPEKEDTKTTEQEEEISSTDDSKKGKETPKVTASSDEVASDEISGSEATNETGETMQKKTGLAKETNQTTFQFDETPKKKVIDSSDSEKTDIDVSNEKK